jgi:hypothetical protein
MMDAIDRYENMAEQFYREAGMMAPGKSQPAAFMGTPSIDERFEAWDNWHRRLMVDYHDPGNGD